MHDQHRGSQVALNRWDTVSNFVYKFIRRQGKGERKKRGDLITLYNLAFDLEESDNNDLTLLNHISGTDLNSWLL